MPAPGTEGLLAVAFQFGEGAKEVGGVAVGETEGGELAAEDVLLDGGGAQAEGGDHVPQAQQGLGCVGLIGVHRSPFDYPSQ